MSDWRERVHAVLTKAGVTVAGAPHLSAIERRERELDNALPAAVREVYAHDPDMTMLRRFSNCDEPDPITTLGALNAKELGEGVEIAGRLVVFMTENQGVCYWAVDADGGDDPPVYVAVDAMPRPRWRLHNASFISFLECQVWDHSPHPFVACAQARPLCDVDLDLLLRTMREGPTTTGWPADRQRRFDSDDGSVLLWEAEDQTDWFIRADDGEAFGRLLDRVWAECELGNVLYAGTESAASIIVARRERPEAR